MRLISITNEEMKRDRDRQTHAEWGKALTVEQYLEREQRLRSHPWSRATMTTWFWVDHNGAVLASCETFRMNSSVDGSAGHSYAVASVFTEPSLRGRGHAGRMM